MLRENAAMFSLGPLGHLPKPDEALEGLAKQLDATYRQTADHFEKNDDVRVEYQNDKPTLTITNLDKLDEPPSLIALRDKVTALLPRIDLTELLLEIHAHTGFADEFTHIRPNENIAAILYRRTSVF